MERVPQDKLEEWIHQMNQPLPGREKKPTEEELADDGESFMAAMTQLKGA